MLTTLPALCRVSLISLAYFLCEKKGVEEIVRPRPPRDDPVTLTHRPRGNHAQSIASNGDQKDDKTLLQHSQLSQHGEFWHVSVSERQRSRPCGQNLRVPFQRTVLPPEVEESARAMAANGETKAFISPPPR